MVNQIKRVIQSKYNPFTFISAPSSELELRNDKNLTQNLTQTSRRNNKGPTI
jgi:hypothetical protein